MNGCWKGDKEEWGGVIELEGEGNGGVLWVLECGWEECGIGSFVRERCWRMGKRVSGSEFRVEWV